MNKKSTSIPTVKLNLGNILTERKLKPDDVVDMCNEAGTPITRTTVYNMLNPYATGIYLSSLTAICNGLKITPADLFVLEERQT